VTNKDKTDIYARSESHVNSAAACHEISLAARLAVEIPKPKDWQAFQRNCVLLFRAELNDPNAQEYGRGGQDQNGIDVLGKREGNPDHYVGIQCRHIKTPLKEEKILNDCRAALEIKAGLKEIIFATTAPDDKRATNAAINVERTLRDEGRDVAVVLYGWAALQILISLHDVAYTAFFPSVVATTAPQVEQFSNHSRDAQFASQVAAQVVEQLRQTGLTPPPRDTGASGSADEDPALHARIDTYRDLFKDQKLAILAEKGLLALLEKEALDNKPWARFRIETNLGSIAIDLGREAEAVGRYEAAFAIRPDDPNAIANLALARTIQGIYEEAMDLARRALSSSPRCDHAIAYLLQAAALSPWQGNPETLIPNDLVGSEHSDLGLAEFLRRRRLPGWEERSLELCRNHLDQDAFKRIRAIAVLSLALQTGGAIPGVHGLVTFEELNAAADDLKSMAKHCLDVGFADQHDLFAHISNASLLLRIAGRHAESEALLLLGLPSVPNEPQLRRLLALAQVVLGKRREAMALLQDDDDIENQLLGAELTAPDDPGAALNRILAIDVAKLDPRLARLRWNLVGELALKTGEMEILQSTVVALRDQCSSDISADLLEVRIEQKAGLDEDAVHERLRAIAARLPMDIDMLTRFSIAEELRDQDLPEEASMLLENHVDLSRKSPAVTLYLQCLAAARRDDAFLNAIAGAGAVVRQDPEILWTTAIHAWNLGDLIAACRAVDALLAHEPNNARARLLQIEVFIRQDRSTDVFTALEKRIEDLSWIRLRDQFRVASLLGHFGYSERAAAFAYRLFLEHRDTARAWMTLSTIVLKEGRGGGAGSHIWDAPMVATNVAIDLRYDNGENLFLVVEPDATLRALDSDSWESDHPLVRLMMGMSKEARFVDPNGREGTIIELRHKYVARLHYVMEHYESRFPEIFGFRKIPFDAKRPEGLDELIAELKTRHDWVEQEQEQYRNGPWPLGVLAHRLGLDTIEVSSGLAEQGILLKVANGDVPEREAAVRAVSDNACKGCVLDLLAYWTAWRLQALDVIVATCGPIHLTQSVLDHLRARREMIEFSMTDGLRSARYEAGRLVLHEAAPEVVREWRDDANRSIAWAEANATISPLVAGEDTPPVLREQLRAGLSDIFDSVVLATRTGLLLVTDDRPTREISLLVGGAGGVWLHHVFGMAVDRHHIDVKAYIRWSAQLIEAGHNYISVSGFALTQALRLDSEAGEAPGYLFKTLSKMIGGRGAEPRSHIRACLQCLSDLWADFETSTYRQPATGILLRQLVRERHDDYVLILRVVLHLARDFPQLVEYIDSWARGHFIPDGVLQGN